MKFTRWKGELGEVYIYFIRRNSERSQRIIGAHVRLKSYLGVMGEAAFRLV